MTPTTGADAPLISIGLHRRRAATLLAGLHGGVLSRDLLRDIEVDADAIDRECRNERWLMHGWNTVAMHTSDLSVPAQRWRAIWETNAAAAVLDGVTALQVAGLKNYADDLIHVSVVGGASAQDPDGVLVHRVRHRPTEHVLTNGLPRTRPEVAAIRAAQWAVSDREAALLLAMTMQQRLTTPERLVAASQAVRGRTRRAFIPMIVRDVALGAHSLGELDFLDMCRRHGLPPPTHQAIRVLPDGSAYLDAVWEDAGLAVEIDGSGHRWGLAVADDNLRQNAVTLGDTLVLRMNLIGLRLHEAEFMAQVRTGRQNRLAARAG